MRFLEVVDGRPPNFAAIVAVFPDASKAGVMFAYGGRIYAPGLRVVTPALQAHETVHIERQGSEPERWWDSYLSNVGFRLEEEIVAHRAEYKAYCRRHSSRLKQSVALKDIAERLASPLYGGIISAEDALRAVNTP